jgi:hypothetical protein
MMRGACLYACDPGHSDHPDVDLPVRTVKIAAAPGEGAYGSERSILGFGSPS